MMTRLGVVAGTAQGELLLTSAPSVQDKLLDLDHSDVASNVVTSASLRVIQERLEKAESRGRIDVPRVFARIGVEPVAPSSVAYPLWP